MSRSTIAGLILSGLLVTIFVLHVTGVFPMHSY
jgi:hypothetical protein